MEVNLEKDDIIKSLNFLPKVFIYNVYHPVKNNQALKGKKQNK